MTQYGVELGLHHVLCLNFSPITEKQAGAELSQAQGESKLI